MFLVLGLSRRLATALRAGGEEAQVPRGLPAHSRRPRHAGSRHPRATPTPSSRTQTSRKT